MNIKSFRVLLSFLVFLFSTLAMAQRAEFAFSAGQSRVSDTHVTFDCPTGLDCANFAPLSVKTAHNVFWEATLSARMIDAKLVSVHLEVPFAWTAHQQATFIQAPNVFTANLSSFYVTPSIKTKFFPAAPISPWISLGGGLAHFHFKLDPSNKLAVQLGTGADIKTPVPHFGLRVELRDFLSSQPSFATPGVPLAGSPTSGGLTRHNVFAGGGFVIHF